MPFFVILIVISLAFYVFYKIQYFRTKPELERKWISSKSSIALGCFVAFYGLNSLILKHTTTGTIVGSVFLLIGAASVWAGVKAYRYYLPLVVKEGQENHSKT